MRRTILLLSLFFIVIVIAETTTLDLCNQQNLKNVTSYRYKDEQAQNCNCINKLLCIRKCCAIGFYVDKGVCLRSSGSNLTFNVPVYRKKTFVRNATTDGPFLVGAMNCDFFALISDNQLQDWFHVQEDGNILTSVHGLLSNDYYCVDYLKDLRLVAFVCYLNDAPEASRTVYAAGMIISMPFLLVTFIVYALLPERNLHMKALMFYVLSLMFAYLFLVIVQLTESRFPDEVCYSIGYFCLVFFLVSFFWMNVICIDIWLAFSGLRGFSGSKKIAERRRFYIYCVYAIGMPILHAVIVILIQKFSKPSSWFNPGIGEGQCFLRRGFPELLYFYGPMGVLITINIIFFAITAIRIRTVKKDTSVLKREDSKRHSYENDKQNFNLYLKLLFAMGVNWSMEIISWAVIWAGIAPDAVWYLTDFCNAIYGVFIFFIFVFKRNIWKLLKKRFYSFTGKAHLAHSMASTNTRVTSYSTNNTSENPTGAEGIMLSTHIN